MVVRNPSAVPVVVEDVGFRLKSGRRVPAAMNDGPPFPPLALEPGHQFAAYSNIVELATFAEPAYDNDPATHAWVRRSGRRYTQKKLPDGWLERWAARHPPARE